MFFSLKEMNQMQAEERRIAREKNSGLDFKTVTDEEKKSVSLNTTMYRFEFPKMSEEQAIRLFNRLYMDCYRHIQMNHDNTLLALLGFSCHKRWTPYTYITGEKGGRPKKVFNAMPAYKRQPHVHFAIMGNKARSEAERIYKNLARRKKQWKPFKDCVRSQHSISPLYVEWQSNPYYTFGGDLNDFIADEDLLNFA
ncbi:MAG: hypothetical protein IJR00_01355 [Lachnospiraceae bacterium]|nr:hypothetical protein [Lachnospiraceae bacterium]